MARRKECGVTSVPARFFSTSTANVLTCKVIGCIFSFLEMRSRGLIRENLMIFCGGRIVNGFKTDRITICCPAVTIIRFRSVLIVNGCKVGSPPTVQFGLGTRESSSTLQSSPESSCSRVDAQVILDSDSQATAIGNRELTPRPSRAFLAHAF